MDAALIGKLENEIAGLEELLVQKKAELERLKSETPQPEASASYSQTDSPAHAPYFGVNKLSAPKDKIALFRSLFRGREDVYAKRFESKKTGKSGYQPVCKNEWREVCKKPQITCGVCPHRSFEPVTDEVIRNHLAGSMPGKNGWNAAAPFVMGIYPLLQNETCHLLALDFDKQSWQEDVKAFAKRRFWKPHRPPPAKSGPRQESQRISRSLYEPLPRSVAVPCFHKTSAGGKD
jgi:hypothetical protein